jgi:uncharacterized protein (UPF0147 family)
MDEEEYIITKSNVIKKLNEISQEFNYSPEQKLCILEKIIKTKEYEEFVLECLWKLRDIIPFINGYDLEDNIELLYKITLSDNFSSHERLITATCLCNHGYILKCYQSYFSIASDVNAELMNRVEAAKFLFSSDNEDYQQKSQDIIIEIIDDMKYSSEKRYNIIASFITRSGIRTFLNKSKLRIGYDELFVSGLQNIFFHNSQNGVRERILSGQHLLQMNCTSEEEHVEIENYFLTEIAQNESYDENTRADAADVILRLSSSTEQKLRARKIIGQIGTSSKENSKNTLIEKAKTIYTNSQNVHDFTDQADSIIQKLIEENVSLTAKKFTEIHNIVASYTRNTISDREKRFKILKALNRISIDTATFTSYNSTVAEIFVLVWLKVEQSEELKIRLLEELIDMNDTCSSGHVARLINTISNYDDSITFNISWEQQFISNFVGRMNAKIRDCPDPLIQSSLTLAIAELGDEKDKKIYQDFILENTPLIRDELYKEFVNEKHISVGEFDKYFEMARETI